MVLPAFRLRFNCFMFVISPPLLQNSEGMRKPFRVRNCVVEWFAIEDGSKMFEYTHEFHLPEGLPPSYATPDGVG